MRSKALCITKTDIYTKITNEIISAIESGATDFEIPWHRQAQAGLPRNPATKNLYRGVNALTLWIIRRKLGFASSYWASYLQWKSLGAQVRHGEKGATVIFYKRKEEDENSEEDETTNQARTVIRYSSEMCIRDRHTVELLNPRRSSINPITRIFNHNCYWTVAVN